jgi:ubiquitin carboxyl-terminal hydrolase 5/13
LIRIKQAESEEPPTKITKLAIVEERDEDKYDTITALRCWKCDPVKGSIVVPAPSSPVAQHAEALVDAIIKSASSARQSEIKAWEEEITACEHTLTLQQLNTGHIPASGMPSLASSIQLFFPDCADLRACALPRM